MPKTTKKFTGFSQKSNPKMYKSPQYGGKNFRNSPYKRDRRFSIVSSSSSDMSEDRRHSDSGSESSLTAMSEKDEQSHSRRGSALFQRSKLPKARAKTYSTAAKKRAPKKGPKASYASVFESDKDSDIEVDDDNSDSDGIGEIYAMVGSGNQLNVESNSDDTSDSDDDDDDDNSSVSSSDDSEVDFVQLQAERRAHVKSSKSLKAVKALHKQHEEAKKKSRRKSSYRRQSEVPLPDNLNFKFEFDDVSNENALEEESDQDDLMNLGKKQQPEEEDLGEEVSEDTGDSKQSYNLNFQFDEPIIDVPKIKEDELQSEDDYEFDDNDLLATLQADNDIEEFLTTNPAEDDLNSPKERQRSVSSLNGDETLDPFLEEEEKYLVNEFEMNGFDDENDIGSVDDAGKSSFAKGITRPNFNENLTEYDHDVNENNKAESFDSFFEDEEEDEVDEFMDLMEFDTPLFDDESKESESSLSDLKLENGNANDRKPSEAKETKKTEKKSKSSRRRPKTLRGPLDSEEEDDSYLWNYFLSSDGASDVDVDLDLDLDAETIDVEEQLILEQVFQQEKALRDGTNDREFSLEPLSDQEYDSGESTDVDLSLPPSSKRNQTGSKVAKEVLSSKTADYRPPVLGTWVAIESKPFGIIDGLSTRSLKNNQNAQKNPRTRGWKSLSIGVKNEHEDSAIELEELLNISELDNDDENDIRIWRDFNNRKKRVPLGAFRNKTHLNDLHIGHEPSVAMPKMKSDFGSVRRPNQRRRESKQALGDARSSSETQMPAENNVSKSKRRKASAVEAAVEGFIPTKSGLFSANMLTDAEEVMGDDRDFMALIKGL